MSRRLDTVNAYHAMGFNLLPIVTGKKRPAGDTWEQWIDHRQSPEDLAALGWDSTGVGAIGAVSGPVSGDLVCLDVDGAPDDSVLSVLLASLELPFDYPWQVKTPGGGYHIWVRCPGLGAHMNGTGKLIGDLDGCDHVELRFNGHQTLVPPSAHPSGHAYAFIVSGLRLPTTTPIVVAPEALLAVATWRNKREPPPSPPPPTPARLPVSQAGRVYTHFFESAIDGEARKCRTAPDGDRHNQVVRSAKSLGGFEHLGLRLADVESALVAAHMAAPGKDTPTEHEARAAVRDGWKYGAVLPREVKDNPEWNRTDSDAVAEDDPDAPVRYAFTDLGNGERFAARFGGQLRYEKASNNWRHWDGRRWAYDETLEAERYAAKTARDIYAEAAREESLEVRRQIIKFALASESRERQQAMSASARHMLTIAPRDWDPDPWLLNCENGTVDLRTGRLMPHRQEDLITMVAPVEYDPKAKAPMFEAFLAEIQPDPEVRSHIQRAIGYSACGVTREHHFWFALGVGANGKSTLLNLLLTILGDYASQAPPDLLIASRGRHPTEIAFLRAARLVVATETQAESKLDEVRVKEMTGGDALTARYMRGDFFTFKPTHTIWMVGNHRPIISGTDVGIWRRPLLVDFPVTIPREKQDGELPEKLLSEAPGVLRWIVEGCLAWQKEGLRPPQSVLTAVAGYQKDMDVVGQWLDDQCILDPNVSESSATLYQDYQKWCESSGERYMKQRSFGTQLVERGFIQSRGHGGKRIYIGLRLSGDAGDASNRELPISSWSSSHEETYSENASHASPASPTSKTAFQEPLIPECSIKTHTRFWRHGLAAWRCGVCRPPTVPEGTEWVDTSTSLGGD